MGANCGCEEPRDLIQKLSGKPAEIHEVASDDMIFVDYDRDSTVRYLT